MDSKQRAYAARNLLKDETFNEALEAVKQALVHDLLRATTQEEREELWHGHDALKRAMARIANWAQGAKP